MLEWLQAQNLSAKTYNCGFCGNIVASEKGWSCRDKMRNQIIWLIRICPSCSKPTFFDFGDEQIPSTTIGSAVKHISDQEICTLYEEARRCAGNEPTATVLCCRKILMHVAVSKGAPENQNFKEYVDYLSTNHYVPPDSKPWVDRIRTKGNEANHEIVIMTKEDAKDIIDFTGMLLKLVFEFPTRANQPLSP